eukprot:1491512-Pyramimonas_sp.AAC.1
MLWNPFSAKPMGSLVGHSASIQDVLIIERENQRDMTLYPPLSYRTHHPLPPPPAVFIQSRRRPRVRAPPVFFSQYQG